MFEHRGHDDLADDDDARDHHGRGIQDFSVSPLRSGSTDHHHRHDHHDVEEVAAWIASRRAAPGAVDEHREVDGYGNNLDNPGWGQANAPLLRLAEPEYGVDPDTGAHWLPAGADRENPRVISNMVVAQDASIPNAQGFSDYIWAWGQFVDHDIDLTEAGSEPFYIPVPAGDPVFDPMGNGDIAIHLDRVDPMAGTGDGPDNPPNYPNQISAFIDGSNIYGSSQAKAEALMRADGTLVIGDDSLLLLQPDDTSAVFDAGSLQTGDVRALENVALTSLHTLFVLEHNRLVAEFHATQPGVDGETAYWQARQVVEAEMQAITYNEWLPLVLGSGAPDPTLAYDPGVDPGISVEFSTAAFRFGHSLLSSQLLRIEENGDSIENGALDLAHAFFAYGEITDPENGGIEALLRGLAAQTAQEVDVHLVDDVRNMLFGSPASGAMDLASLNLQRGRDMGLPDYNTLRESVGLERIEEFAEITSDVDVQAALAMVYQDVDDIDPWLGMLAEDHVNGGLLGETAARIVGEQFQALATGDRFFGLRDAGDDIWSTTLADIIERNTDVDAIQDNAFYAYARIVGDEGSDRLCGSPGRDLMLGNGGNDRLVGGRGDDQMEGGRGSDMLIDGSGNDIIDGGPGHDMMWGGSGDDVLTGGAGNDIMIGGTGSDRFVFDNASDSDRIFGFDAFDVLDLSGVSDLHDIHDLRIRESWFGTIIAVEEGPSILLVGLDADDVSAGQILV